MTAATTTASRRPFRARSPTPPPASYWSPRRIGTGLDAFEATTGRLLTERGPTSYTREQTRPPHYLDYFHGALHVSPDGRWIVDDGWVWAPVGAPRAWSLDGWLDANVWEGEDGESCIRFRQLPYHWDSPMCWLDERRVVLWGLGTDDEQMLAGATVLVAETGVRISEFAGPSGRLWSDGRRLYAAADVRLTVWDPLTGDRTCDLPDLDVLAHNRDLDEFVIRRADGLARVRLVPS